MGGVRLSMRVTVRFLGPFEKYSDERERALELPKNASVCQALQLLAAELDEAFREDVLGNTAQVRHMVLVNGSSLFEQGWETVLEDGDVVSLVAPTAGG